MIDYIAHALVAIGILLPEIVKLVPIVERETAEKVYIGAALLLLLGTCVRIVFGLWSDRRIVKLGYIPKSGLLIEERLEMTNVSLRRDTLKSILRECPPDKLRALGSEVGSDFWGVFRDHMGHVGSFFNWWGRFKRLFLLYVISPLSRNYSTSSEKEIAKMWAAYDSSAGFGLFDVRNLRPDLSGETTVTNCFTVDSDSCLFMEGYVEAILSGIGGSLVKAKHTYDNNVLKHSAREGFDICTFTITH